MMIFIPEWALGAIGMLLAQIIFLWVYHIISQRRSRKTFQPKAVLKLTKDN